MADEKAVQDANQKSAKSGGGGGMLPALLVIFLMPLISFAMFKFIFLPELKKSIPESSQAGNVTIDPKSVHVETSEKREYKFPEAFVANLAGSGGGRYIRMNLSIESSNPNIAQEVEEHSAAIYDAVDTILRNLNLAETEQAGIKDILRNQIQRELDHILQPPMVDAIYFNFVVQ